MKVSIQDIHVDETPQLKRIFEEINCEVTSFKYYELENPVEDSNILLLAANHLANQFVDSKPFILTIVGTTDLKDIKYLTSHKNFLFILSTSKEKHQEAVNSNIKSIYIHRRYEINIKDVQPINHNFESINSIITNYASYWPDAYEKFKNLSELNPKTEIKHYGTNEWINDIDKIKESKYLLHIKYKGHVCNAVVKSLALGVPVIMDKLTYSIGSYYGYLEHEKNSMIFETIEEISNYINNDKQAYKILKQNCFKEAEKYHFSNMLTEEQKNNLISLINI